MPTWKEGDHGSLDLPAPESPVWLPNLAAPKGSPGSPGGAATRSYLTHAALSGKLHGPHSPGSPGKHLHTQKSGRHGPGQPILQPSAALTGPQGHVGLQGRIIQMPKARDMPAAFIHRSPHDAAGLYTIATLPTVEPPGMRGRTFKVGCARARVWCVRVCMWGCA